MRTPALLIGFVLRNNCKKNSNQLKNTCLQDKKSKQKTYQKPSLYQIRPLLIRTKLQTKLLTPSQKLLNSKWETLQIVNL